jgi:magnesium chelatase family protein
MVPMTEPEALGVTSLFSVAGLLSADRGMITSRPLRAPHHTVSAVGLVGGGDPIRPGEVSLAHEGVLFLDETHEFRTSVLDGLREPLREGHVWIYRARARTSFPAKALIVGAANPCPCGYAGDPSGRCTCPTARIYAYQQCVPLLFDMACVLPPLDAKNLASAAPGESSAVVRERVIAGRRRAIDRQGCPSTELSEEALARWATPDAPGAKLVAEAHLGRAVMARALRVARTIADLDACDVVLERHVAEAVHVHVDRREVAVHGATR